MVGLKISSHDMLWGVIVEFIWSNWWKL